MQETLGSDELVGTIVAGRYLIEKRLGNGAMGAVYRARHVKLGRPFAIKILHDHLSDEKVLKRFEREAEIAGKLHHPNLVSVVDVGAIQGRSFLVMELAPGSNLAGLLIGPWPASRMIPLVRQLCDGLHYAHELGLIHRDFKPENVLVERHADNRETPRIVDFGIAILRDATAERFTTAGLVLGTPQYMAPEQACAADMDHRVDLFALGVICFELLTGRAPFDGTGVEIARANLLTPTPSMASRAPTVQVDPLLEAFTRKLLSKAKEDRPVSAAATRQLLDLIERDRPAAAKALKVVLPKTTALAPPVVTSGPIPRPVAVAAPSRADIGTDQTVEAAPARRAGTGRKAQRRMMVAGVATIAFASAITIGVWAARRSSDESTSGSANARSSTAPAMAQSSSPTSPTSSSATSPTPTSSSTTSPTSSSMTSKSSSTTAMTSSGNSSSTTSPASPSAAATSPTTNGATSSTIATSPTTTSTSSTTASRTSSTTATSSSMTSPTSSTMTSPTSSTTATPTTTSTSTTTSRTSSTNAATSMTAATSSTNAATSTTSVKSSTNAATSTTSAKASTTAATSSSSTSSTSSMASPSATAVANLYVAVGGELKTFSEANGQSAAADLWSRYRRIPLNDVLVTPARRQATTELLLAIRRDLSARRSQ